MNLIEDNFEQKKQDNTKKIARIILIIIAILIVAIIALFGAIVYVKNGQLKLFINGTQNDKVKDMMVVEEDGTVYFPIKDIAQYLGYQAYNGEYADKSEESSKCYVQCEDEVANFVLNSKTIYKLALQGKNNNYDYYEIKKPVKAIGGKLYVTSEGLEKAFNILFEYNTETNRVRIYTMPYLIESYQAKILDYGYTEISNEFVNKKTVLKDMLIVSKDDKMGVINVNGNTVLDAKYDNIEYLPLSGNFIVTSNNKVGMLSPKKETKIQIIYDNLKLIDNSLGLYVAGRDEKYGVIDSDGNIKVFIEYDEIGIDNTKFEKNDIKNGYLLANKLIPVRKDKFWGLYDKNGKQLVDFEYDEFGYIASSNKDAMNLLIIPNYDVIVAKKNNKYTLINSNGELVIKAPVLDDVYMTISGGKKHYTMTYNDNVINVEEYLDSIDAKTNNR